VNRYFGETEGERHQSAALALLLNRVVLGLVGEARQADGFGDDETALRSRAKDLVEQFVDREATPAGASVHLDLLPRDRIEIRIEDPRGLHAGAQVRGDGFVLGSSTGRFSRGEAVTIDPADLEPWEREEMRRQDLADKARRGKARFIGRDYRRTLVAPPQPDAALRVLAAALYGDGLLVEFTYDTEEPTKAQMESQYFPPRPAMRIEDDLGTKYYAGERASYGGSPASLGYFTFAPAVPAAARVLRITTDSGAVEIDLQQ
jgi:hypothetical protein